VDHDPLALNIFIRWTQTPNRHTDDGICCDAVGRDGASRNAVIARTATLVHTFRILASGTESRVPKIPGRVFLLPE
jgi:hypothetical protein